MKNKDWEEDIQREYRFIIDSWVKRLVSLGQIKEYSRSKGGFTIFQCAEAEEFIQKQITKAREEGVAEGRREGVSIVFDKLKLLKNIYQIKF